MQTLHNPDRYMIDLRQIMSQGRKRIGLFIGAGAPTSIRVDDKGKISPAGSALIPDVAGLTGYVLEKLVESDRTVIDGIMSCTRFRRHQVRCFMEQEVRHGEKAVYEPQSGTLEVEFVVGTIYQYYGVPQNIYDQFMREPSKGRFLNTYIKNQYAFSRVG
jgi:hypothetical protein